jgi:hypothetical protein
MLITIYDSMMKARRHKTSVKTESGTAAWLTPMPQNFVDCTPFNLLLTDGGLHQIDLEWTYAKCFTLGPLALRYLTRYATLPAAAKLFDVPDRHHAKNVEIIRRVLARIELVPDSQAYQDYIFLHDEIKRIIFPDKPRCTDETLSKMLTMPNVDVAQHMTNTGSTAGTLYRLGCFAVRLYERYIGWRFKHNRMR